MRRSSLRSTRSEPNGEWIPTVISIGLILVVGLLSFLSFIAIKNAGEGDSQKKRADALQKSLDVLRKRSEEDRIFFDTIRRIIIVQNEEDRQKLIEELRNFEFSTGSGVVSSTRRPDRSTTTTTPSSSTTSTTGASSTTTTTRPTLSTTTTTTRPTSSTTTTTRVCVTNPIIPIPVCA